MRRASGGSREAVDAAVALRPNRGERLEAACAAHLAALHRASRFYPGDDSTLPHEAGAVGPRIRDLRRDYEQRFRSLIDDLALPPEIDRHYLRLLLVRRAQLVAGLVSLRRRFARDRRAALPRYPAQQLELASPAAS